MVRFDKMIMQKVKDAAHTRTAMMAAVTEASPAIHYSQGCIQEADLVLPLFNYVKGKTLALKSYALSKGHCRALASACRSFDD